MKRLVTWLTAGCALALAADWLGDWLNIGGDPQHSGWQKHGKHLTISNAKDLKPLWRRRLDSALTAPVIMGPAITHRGVRELIFAGGASDNLYAVDADLGTLFWKRHFETGLSDIGPCSGLVSIPAIEPDPDEDLSGDAPGDEDDDDEAGPMRPVYIVASDGKLHKIRASDGADLTPPIAFLPANANASSLNLWFNMVYATTSHGCAGSANGVWALDVLTLGAKPKFSPGVSTEGVAVGFDGRVYSDFAASFFKWKGKAFVATARHGGLLLLDGKNLHLLAKSEALKELKGGLATWQDRSGTRWIYAAAAERIVAFRLDGTVAKPTLERVWESREVVAPGPPVVTNGVVFILARGDEAKKLHATLFALDAATGNVLYSSKDAIASFTREPALAVANGHVCFGAADNALYCFGIPLEP